MKHNIWKVPFLVAVLAAAGCTDSGTQLDDPALASPMLQTSVHLRVSALVLFPYVTMVTSGSGKIEPSSAWDGTPHNFFNDPGCHGHSHGCSRYEPFAPGTWPERMSVTQRAWL